MKIGVFDSGIGGLSVAKAIEEAIPEAEVIFLHDTPDHFPYAKRHPEEIYGYIKPIFSELITRHCEVIVVACNTVSTTLIKKLREDFSVPMVAIEPMIKPASELTKSKVITVCATPTTLSSERYKWLKNTYAKDITVLEPDCSDWSYLIENSAINEARIKDEILPTLNEGSDVIVLGCTHYHWIEGDIKEIVKDRATVIQPESAIVNRLKKVLKQPA